VIAGRGPAVAPHGGGKTVIMLGDIIKLDNPAAYKLHLACRNEDGIEPLDEYVTDHAKWVGWNEWRRPPKDGRPGKNEWTRPYIFSLMQFYPQDGCYLFGGVFQVVTRHIDRYDIQRVVDYDKFDGRVIVRFERYQGMRGRAFNLENFFDQLELHEILPQRYSGEAFCGYDKIDHDFNVLESIFKIQKGDWKAALGNVKGVYLISDKSNGKIYVGSAYGGVGVWSRWACYLQTGHGWNDELTKIINQQGVEYARRNFTFSLLGTMDMKAPDQQVIERECHWKNVLRSREHGYNKN
jgi:hypothetical protein